MYSVQYNSYNTLQSQKIFNCNTDHLTLCVLYFRQTNARLHFCSINNGRHVLLLIQCILILWCVAVIRQ